MSKITMLGTGIHHLFVTHAQVMKIIKTIIDMILAKKQNDLEVIEL